MEQLQIVIVSALVGAFLGVLIMCLVIMAGRIGDDVRDNDGRD